MGWVRNSSSLSLDGRSAFFIPSCPLNRLQEMTEGDSAASKEFWEGDKPPGLQEGLSGDLVMKLICPSKPGNVQEGQGPFCPGGPLIRYPRVRHPHPPNNLNLNSTHFKSIKRKESRPGQVMEFMKSFAHLSSGQIVRWANITIPVLQLGRHKPRDVQ